MVDGLTPTQNAVPSPADVLLLAALGGFLLAGNVEAATFIVNKTADDNGPCDPVDCALREAVLAANALPGMDTVRVPAGTYQLSIPENLDLGGDIDITDDIEIIGIPGSTTVLGTGLGGFQDRIFDMTSNLPVVVSLVGLSIAGGHADFGGGVNISGQSTVELIECHIYNNEATIDGGGVNTSLSSLTVNRTTIADNIAQRSGAGIRRNGGLGAPSNLVVRNSTISNNSADLDGGAVFSRGGVGELRIENSTLVENQAGRWGDLIMQDLSIGPQFLNSILEGDCFFIASGFPTSFGGNVGRDADFCFLDQPSDQDGVADLGILPLGDYGGPTPTHAISQFSPAVDAALLADCPPDDQRGEPRPVDGDFDGQADCDAGSFELQPVDTPGVAVPALSFPGLVAFVALLMAAAAWLLYRTRLAASIP